ncbi:MAG: hypothetical protein K9N55_11360 [Phycisphaerae bacterium]|nr:hypothetical protein [Phycisphaerae bacterium]
MNNSDTDVCDAGHNNVAQMRQFEFWKASMDCLARNQYHDVLIWRTYAP